MENMNMKFFVKSHFFILSNRENKKKKSKKIHSLNKPTDVIDDTTAD